MSTDTIVAIPRHKLPPVPPRPPYVGQPATIRLFNDTKAAVVVHVTPKTVIVSRVETGPTEPDMRCDVGAYGVRPVRAEGILDRIVPGTRERFTLRKNGRYHNGSISLTLGHSVSFTDYRV
jgi:hypothetical protein